MTRQKMTRQEAGRLGGLQYAHNHTAAERSEQARKGGEANVEKHGRAHMLRLRLNQRQAKPAE